MSTTTDPWHALELPDVLQRLQTSRQGLDAAEAEVRLERDGLNALAARGVDPWWLVLFRQFSSVIIILLVASVAVTAVLQRWVDAIAILIAVLADVTLGFVQEMKAARDVAALRVLAVQRCHAIRSGAVTRIPSSELVVGDLVVLESGDRVPADLRLLEAARVRVDESLLTGESIPVGKTAATVPADTPQVDRHSVVWSGSLVVAGRATGVVFATGPRTAIGEIDTLVRAADTPTPMQRMMRRFEGRLGIVVGTVSLLSLAAGLVTGLGFADAFLNAVALAVAAIPEGLPVVLTIALSLGVSRMARHRAIVRTLPAVEALGSTTVIASDKTGTMTMNRMAVERIWTPFDEVDLTEGVTAVTIPSGCRQALRAAALSNDAHHDPETGAVIGDPVDVAVARLALEHDVLTDQEFTAPPLAHAPYEPEHRCSVTVSGDDTGDDSRAALLLVKGSPELLIPASIGMAGAEGAQQLDHDRIAFAHDAMTGLGMRVLAVARRRLRPGEDPRDALADLERLEFVGLLGMSDPPRPGVADAIRACHKAGVTVMMITGDHPRTAAAIGARLDLVGTEPPITGVELEKLDDTQAVVRLRAARIAARVSPIDKLRIVRILEAAGEVVAVTGDGVNDAPALKTASLGVAMGRSGTDVAREAADIVLTDDDFGTIVRAVHEGRVTFAAVQKATFFLISTGAAALVAVTGNLLLDAPLIFLPVQMIWFNLVSNGIQDVGLAFEPGEGDELDRPPRRAKSGLLTGRLWWRIAITGVWMGLAVLAAFHLALAAGLELDTARTFALTAFAFLNLFQTFSARSIRQSVFRQSPFTNRFLVAAAFGSLAVHVAAVSTPLGQDVLGLAPLSFEQWLIAAAIGVTVLGVVEVDKALVARAGVEPATPRL